VGWGLNRSVQAINPAHTKQKRPIFLAAKLPIGREPEFRDMNPFSGIGVVSLEFRVSTEVGIIA
jgi:hypothetical protein